MKPQPPLLPDEPVLWEGRPDSGLSVQPAEWSPIPFSLLFGVLIWYFFVPQDFRLYRMYCLTIAVILIGRFLLDLTLRKRLRYFVTDRRILILRGRRRIQSLDLKGLPVCEVEERADGSGTLWFGPSSRLFRSGDILALFPGLGLAPRLLRIADVRNVYTLIYTQSARLETMQPTA